MEDPGARRRIIGRIVFLAITGVAFYLVAPSLMATFDAVPTLKKVFPVWFVVVAIFEVASFICLWHLQRVALGTKEWFSVACSHLAGNAVSRALPGGVATAGAVQLRMLNRAGFETTHATTALTAAGLLSTATLFALPVIALPAIPLGLAIQDELVNGAVIAAIMFAVLLGISGVLLTSDRAMGRVSRSIAWVARLFSRDRNADLAPRIVEARNVVRDGLRDSWKHAVPAAGGNRFLDFLALYASLLAVGSDVDPLLVLLAYVAAGTLSMIPITPGGLGFVEAGLTGVLALAGVPGPEAVLATLVYRLFSYWLPLPAGLVASVMFNHRYRATGIPNSSV